jgi:aliphatic nitrilase
MLMDSAGHYNRPELLSLLIDRTPAANLHERGAPSKAGTERQGSGDLYTSPARAQEIL